MSEATATTQIIRLYDTGAQRRHRRQALWTYGIGSALVVGALLYLGLRLVEEHRLRVEAEARIKAMPSVYVPIEDVVR